MPCAARSWHGQIIAASDQIIIGRGRLNRCFMAQRQPAGSPGADDVSAAGAVLGCACPSGAQKPTSGTNRQPVRRVVCKPAGGFVDQLQRLRTVVADRNHQPAAVDQLRKQRRRHDTRRRGDDDPIERSIGRTTERAVADVQPHILDAQLPQPLGGDFGQGGDAARC